jgi:hypothetical protein
MKSLIGFYNNQVDKDCFMLLHRRRTVTGLLLAALAISFLSTHFNYNVFDARAQQQKTFNFLITLVQNKPETGEVAVVVSFAGEISTVKRDVDDKKVEVPVTVATFSENIKHDDAKVCVTILSNGEQICKTISNVREDKLNKLTINLLQVKCNTQYCLNQ